MQAKVCVNDADERQVGKVIALRHKLRADHDVDCAGFHLADKFGGLGGGPQRVRCHNGVAGLRKQRGDFIGDPLYAWAARNKRVFFMTFGAGARRRHLMTTVMAFEPLDQPVLDHPRGAVGALKTVAAMATQRQRGKAAPVEKQQALFAARQYFVDRTHQCRREPVAAFGRVLGQIDRGDFGQLRDAVTPRQLDLGVAPACHLLARFDRGGGG